MFAIRQVPGPPHRVPRRAVHEHGHMPQSYSAKIAKMADTPTKVHDEVEADISHELTLILYWESGHRPTGKLPPRPVRRPRMRSTTHLVQWLDGKWKVHATFEEMYPLQIRDPRLLERIRSAPMAVMGRALGTIQDGRFEPQMRFENPVPVLHQLPDKPIGYDYALLVSVTARSAFDGQSGMVRPVWR